MLSVCIKDSCHPLSITELLHALFGKHGSDLDESAKLTSPFLYSGSFILLPIHNRLFCLSQYQTLKIKRDHSFSYLE